MPLGTRTPTPTASFIRFTPMRVAPNIVTAFQYEEERILTCIPFGSATQYEGATVFENASKSEEVCCFEEVYRT